MQDLGLGNISGIEENRMVVLGNGFSRYDMRWGELAYKSFVVAILLSLYECQHFGTKKGNMF